ncbi:hypothetical protein M407DRAFT_120291 [Tulasnella calospora MUT 4182]|uniref:CFEM domain-containing protein n=1 Tax=Tulasnella calospora MUT 4182 TaxID=1051891 RepID=A0A0C3LLC1_9AGAM|nr:hypothetical protein M407DRAFT_120291 [Tulasnella calospora MUT 4182]
MRFAIVVFFAASLASAYTIFKRQDAPACATTCFAQSDFSPCNSTDTACICLNQKFLTALATCTEASCSEQDLQAAEAAGTATCQAAGVNLQEPFPACAQPCVANANSSTCAADDDTCLCKDPNYIGPIVKCIHSSCSGQDLTTAETVGTALCRANGVDITSIAQSAAAA